MATSYCLVREMIEIPGNSRFTEGNKRTALLPARWMLDNDGLDGSRVIDPGDRELADLFVQAAGHNVEGEILRFFADRA